MWFTFPHRGNRHLEWTQWWQHGNPYHALSSLLPVSGVHACLTDTAFPSRVSGGQRRPSPCQEQPSGLGRTKLPRRP